MAAQIPAREITPHATYLDRRTVLRGGVLAAGALATGVVYRRLNGVESIDSHTPEIVGVRKPTGSGFRVTDEELTSFASITNYNNFYEFTTNKDAVASVAEGFSTRGWTITIDGLCARPTVVDLDMLRKLAAPEERVYRMRCVEGWSMVIPWIGIPLAALLARVEPTSAARYVAFETLMDPARFPGQTSRVLAWPYREGLRLDEAMHPLALLATGLYGHELPPQDGAPVRLVTPWKYGFKGIKSIVKISLVADRPATTWSQSAKSEYGFYANVNPHHAHPRWSQATEKRIDESGRRETLMFNGYADEVASLYAGMDLDVHF